MRTYCSVFIWCLVPYHQHDGTSEKREGKTKRQVNFKYLHFLLNHMNYIIQLFILFNSLECVATVNAQIPATERQKNDF